MPARFIGYLRVSTCKQHASGLGIEAQRDAVQRYVSQVGGELLAEHVEVESGKKSARPILSKAIAICRREKAVLLIAKLDRLGRNVAFISSLMDGGVDFVAVDFPAANRLLLHILAAVAENEREQISQRTKAALAVAKSRGTKLGRHGAVLAAMNRKKACEFAEMLRGPLADSARATNCTLQSHADYLNGLGYRTPEGASFRPTSVHRVLSRLNRVGMSVEHGPSPEHVQSGRRFV